MAAFSMYKWVGRSHDGHVPVSGVTMAQLVEQKIDIGPDAYGRQVTMTRKRTYDGKVIWSIETYPANQRDDGERMTGLSDENVRQMNQCLALLGVR